MFDADAFEKLQRDLAREARRLTDTVVKEFEAAFQSLPAKMQAAMGKMSPSQFSVMSGNIGVAPSKRDLRGQWNVAKNQTNAIENQVGLVQKLMQGNYANRVANEKIYSALQKQAKTIEDMLDLDDMRFVDTEKYLHEQAALATMEKNMNSLLDASVAKRRQIALLVLQQTDAAQRALSFQKKLEAVGVAAIGAVLKVADDVYRRLRESGMDGIQAVQQFGVVAKDTFAGWKAGVLAGPAAFAKSLGTLSNAMGSMTVPQDAVVATTRIAQYAGVGQEAASHLVSQMTRLSQWSGKAAANGLSLARNIANARHMNMDTMMRDMAENAGLMANYAGRGFEAFARSLATTRQLGVSMNRISGFADHLVDDFENSITMSAKIQTILPGFDMDQVMYAASFGTDEDVAKSLQQALAGSGLKTLDQLPRQLRNMITNSLGLSPEEVGNLLSGAQKPELTNAGPSAQYNDKLHAIGTSALDLASSNVALIAGIGGLTKAVWSNTGAILSGGLFKKAAGKLGSLLGGGSSAAAGAESGIAGAAGATGGIGLLGKALGLGVGGGLLSGGIDAYMQHKAGMSTGRALEHGGVMGGSVMGGALLGASLGSVVPIIGTVIGGLLGGLAGGFGGEKLADSFFGSGGQPTDNAGELQTLPDGTTVSSMSPPTPATPDLTAMQGSIASMYSSQSNTQRPTAQTEMKYPTVDMSKVEGLLGKLIKAVEAGHVIVMDGREVGKGVLNSYARGGN
jgi:hypothetical protein